MGDHRVTALVAHLRRLNASPDKPHPGYEYKVGAEVFTVRDISYPRRSRRLKRKWKPMKGKATIMWFDSLPRLDFPSVYHQPEQGFHVSVDETSSINEIVCAPLPEIGRSGRTLTEARLRGIDV